MLRKEHQELLSRQLMIKAGFTARRPEITPDASRKPERREEDRMGREGMRGNARFLTGAECDGLEEKGASPGGNDALEA